eukprot:jgi/Mesvir1/27830/Mv07509-RA.1
MGKRKKEEPLPGKANMKITDMYKPQRPPSQQATEGAAAAPSTGPITSAGGPPFPLSQGPGQSSQGVGQSSQGASQGGGVPCIESYVRGDHLAHFYQTALDIEGEYKFGHKNALQLVDALRVEGKMLLWKHIEMLLRHLDNPESAHVAIATHGMLLKLHETFPRVRIVSDDSEAAGPPRIVINADSYSPAASQALDDATEATSDGRKKLSNAAQPGLAQFQDIVALVSRLRKGLEWLAAPTPEALAALPNDAAPGRGGAKPLKKKADAGVGASSSRGAKNAKEAELLAKAARAGGASGSAAGAGGAGGSSVMFSHGIEQDKGSDHRQATHGDEMEWTELKVFGHALHFTYVVELLMADTDVRMQAYRAHRDHRVLEHSAIFQLIKTASWAKKDDLDKLIESLEGILELAGAGLHESDWQLSLDDKAALPASAVAPADAIASLQGHHVAAGGRMSPGVGDGEELLDELGLPAPPGYQPPRRASLGSPGKKGKGKGKAGKGKGKGVEVDGEPLEEGREAKKAKRCMAGLLRQSRARTCLTILRLMAQVLDLHTCLQDVKDNSFVDGTKRQKQPTGSSMTELTKDLSNFSTLVETHLARLARTLLVDVVTDNPSNMVLMDVFLSSLAIPAELKLRFVRFLLQDLSKPTSIHTGADERIREPLLRRTHGSVAKSLASLVAGHLSKLLSIGLHPDALASMVIHALQAGGQVMEDGTERAQYYAEAERLLEAFTAGITQACEQKKYAEGLLTKEASLHAARICASVLCEP